MTGFATLRRKLIRRRRTSKSFDHGKAMRELVADWTAAELAALVDEYEATAALKDLSVQADLARPPASTHKQDLSDLLDYKYAADVTLVFQGARFPAHRAILASRCSYFRELLAVGKGPPAGSSAITAAASSGGMEIHMDSILRTGMDVPTFAGVLRYLYTGDLTGDTAADVLVRLGQEFGTPNALETDLRYLMETGDMADAVLVFASSSDLVGATSSATTTTAAGSSVEKASSSSSAGSDYGFFPWLEIPCHRAVLSARSPFFRSLIQRRTRNCNAAPDGSGGGGGNNNLPMRIVLDESVIPRRYARLLMQCIYLDVVDMNSIVRPVPPPPPPPPIPSTAAPPLPSHHHHHHHQPGLADGQAGAGDEQVIVSCGPSSSSSSTAGAPLALHPPSLFEEATELYQIGRFLELDILSQGCEDVLVDGLSLDQLPQVLRWSELPHGSAWVRRQALHLLREVKLILLEIKKLGLIFNLFLLSPSQEFGSLAQGAPVLLELDKAHLIGALASDFLQASELEVLQAVLRWGEHQLVRRMEDREPNIVAQTHHSVARKGIRRRDLNDVELRDILSELLPHVRVDHVLPPSSETLAQAIRRGLVSTPPSHMIGGDHQGGGRKGHPDKAAWIKFKSAGGGGGGGLYVKPRLFMPYYEEAKTALADQLAASAAAGVDHPYGTPPPLLLSSSSARFHAMGSSRTQRHYGGRYHHHHHHQQQHHNIPDIFPIGMVDDGMMDDETAGLLEPETGSGAAGGVVLGDLDVVTTSGAVPVPDGETLQAMIRRERKLRASPLAQRAYSLPLASRRQVNRQIRLRVVREFNLPDSIAEELELAAYQLAASSSYPASEDDGGGGSVRNHHHQSGSGADVVQASTAAVIWQPRRALPGGVPVSVPIPPKRLSSRHPFGLFQQQQEASGGGGLDVDDGFVLDEDDLNSHGSQLSQFIPDIAALSIAPTAAGASGVGHLVPPPPPEPYRYATAARH